VGMAVVMVTTAAVAEATEAVVELSRLSSPAFAPPRLSKHSKVHTTPARKTPSYASLLGLTPWPQRFSVAPVHAAFPAPRA